MVIPEYQMAIAVTINTNTDVFWDFAEVAVSLANIFRENTADAAVDGS